MFNYRVITACVLTLWASNALFGMDNQDKIAELDAIAVQVWNKASTSSISKQRIENTKASYASKKTFADKKSVICSFNAQYTLGFTSALSNCLSPKKNKSNSVQNPSSAGDNANVPQKKVQPLTQDQPKDELKGPMYEPYRLRSFLYSPLLKIIVFAAVATCVYRYIYKTDDTNPDTDKTADGNESLQDTAPLPSNSKSDHLFL